MYQDILTGIILLISSFTDLKYRKVYKAAAGGYILLALLGHAVKHSAVPGELAMGLLPGAFCLAVSWISRQGLGYGDSILVIGCGLSLGLWPCLTVLFSAFLASGLWAVGLLAFHRAGRKKEMPFVPFLLFGAVLCWFGRSDFLRAGGL